jgi:hypothetical protein
MSSFSRMRKASAAHKASDKKNTSHNMNLLRLKKL